MFVSMKMRIRQVGLSFWEDVPFWKSPKQLSVSTYLFQCQNSLFNTLESCKKITELDSLTKENDQTRNFDENNRNKMPSISTLMFIISVFLAFL